MGLWETCLGNRRESKPSDQEFWEAITDRDPDRLYAQGIQAVQKSDGHEMIAYGWALWVASGISSRQADDFMKDGFRELVSAGVPVDELAPFLVAGFRRLQSISPDVSPGSDVWTLAKDVGARASAECGTRAWFASELLKLRGRSALVDEALVADIHQALSETHRAFLPGRSLDDLRTLDAERGS